MVQAAGEDAIVEYGTQYATICLGFSVGVFCQFCFERLLQSTGRTFFAMCTQLIGALINIVMDPILIFGLFGAPRMEVAGAAAATVAGQVIAACIALVLNIKCNPDVTSAFGRSAGIAGWPERSTGWAFPPSSCSPSAL